MAEDFDEFMDEEYEGFDFDDFDEAELKRRMQDANDGFTFTMTMLDGEHAFKCNKCGRTAPLHERPFPHKLNCPMKDRVKD